MVEVTKSSKYLGFSYFYIKSIRKIHRYKHEQFKGIFHTYKSFKESLNLDTKWRKKFKNDIKQVQYKINENLEKIRHQKRLIVYFYTRSKRRIT